MDTWQLTYTTHGRQPVAPAEGIRRALVRAILRVAGRHVVLFCVVDDHIHVVLLCDRDVAGRYAQALSLAFRGLVGAPVRPAHVSQVNSRRHMEVLVGYALSQTDHHGLECAPALWSGSCFAELVGARSVDGWRANLREALPRFRIEEAYALVGLAGRLVVPVARERVRIGGPRALADAAAFALVVDPDMRGQTAPVVQARRVTICLGTKAGIARQDLAEALGVTRSAVARLVGLPDLDRACLATRVCVALRDAVDAAGRSMPKSATAPSRNASRARAHSSA